MSKEDIVEKYDKQLFVNHHGENGTNKKELKNLYKITNRNGDCIVVDEKELKRLGLELPKVETKVETKQKQTEQFDKKL